VLAGQIGERLPGPQREHGDISAARPNAASHAGPAVSPGLSPAAASRAAQLREVVVEPVILRHDDPVQRSVKAMSLTVHRRREHSTDLWLGGEEAAVEIRHRQVRNRLGQEEWRCGRGGIH
jgi:hypothetical protein